MKSIYILFLFLGLIFSKSFAQNSDVQKIIDQVSAKAKSAKSITANFTISRFDKYGHDGGSLNGLVKIKGNKYYLKEGETEVFCNGTQIWNYDGGNEVTVSKIDADDEDDFSPQQVLSGFNQKDYSYKLLSTTSTFYQVSVTPVDKRKNFKEIVLNINKSTSLISKAKVTDKTEGVNQLAFSGMALNMAIPESQFSFDASKHTNVEVINQ